MVRGLNKEQYRFEIYLKDSHKFAINVPGTGDRDIDKKKNWPVHYRLPTSLSVTHLLPDLPNTNSK